MVKEEKKEKKEKIREWAKSIQQHISVPKDLYEVLYVTPLLKLADICESDEQFIAMINFCRSVLSLRRELLLPVTATVEDMARLEPVWTYGFFTASLLFKTKYPVKKLIPEYGLNWLKSEKELFKLWDSTVKDNNLNTVFGEIFKKAEEKSKK